MVLVFLLASAILEAGVNRLLCNIPHLPYKTANYPLLLAQSPHNHMSNRLPTTDRLVCPSTENQSSAVDQYLPALA